MIFPGVVGVVRDGDRRLEVERVGRYAVVIAQVRQSRSLVSYQVQVLKLKSVKKLRSAVEFLSHITISKFQALQRN